MAVAIGKKSVIVGENKLTQAQMVAGGHGGVVDGLDKLLACSTELEKQVKHFRCLLEEVNTKIALLLCPYKVGQVLVTEKGLGKYGLRVDEVICPFKAEDGNRWAVKTLSFSKAGELTRRGVYIEQSMLPDHGTITIKQ
jgi:hypothetical protein